MKRFLLAFLGWVFFLSAAYGQTSEVVDANIAGAVFQTLIDNHNRPFNLPVPGAAVTVTISGRDSLVSVSGGRGQYSFHRLPPGNIHLRAQCPGFYPQEFDAEIGPGENVIHIKLEKVPEELEAAGITDNPVLLSHHGDTTILNASAIALQEGENAIELLRQMPGVEFKSGNVYIGGELIRRTYVNGRLIYGDDALTPLNSILASDVTHIKVYDEQSVQDRRRGVSNGKKDRVLDVATRNPILSAFDGHVIAAVGADGAKTQENRLQARYMGGLSANFFSERLLLGLKLNGNNIGGTENSFTVYAHPNGALLADEKKMLGQFSVNRYWGDRLLGSSFIASYQYAGSDVSSFSRTESVYYATEVTPQRSYEESSSNASRARSHHIHLFGGVNNSEIKNLSATADLSFASSDAVSDRLMRTVTDTDISQDESQSASNRDWSLKTNLSWRNDMSANGWYPHIMLSGDVGESRNTSLREDLHASSFRRRKLDGKGNGLQWKAGIYGGVSKLVVNRENVSLLLTSAIQSSAFSRKSYSLTLDTLDPDNPVVDLSNSFDYTWSGVDGFALLSMQLTAGKTNFYLLAKPGFTFLQDMERMPVATPARRWFFTPEVHSNLSSRWIRAEYSLYFELPSVEQFRERINDSNPLFLVAGNPSLKPSAVNRLTVKFNSSDFGKSIVSVIGAELNASLTGNNIASKTMYYATATELSGWGGYSVNPGTTVSTFENLPGMWSASGKVTYSGRIARLKLFLQAHLGYNHREQSAFFGENKVSLSGNGLSAGVKLSGKQSRKFSYRAGYSLSLRDERNSLGTGLLREFVHHFDVSSYFRLKYGFFVDAGLGADLYRYLDEDRPDYNYAVLNAAFGKTFFKGRLALSVSGNDLLNAGSSYMNLTGVDCFTQRWTPSFGRYFLFTLCFRLNKTRPTTTFLGAPPQDEFLQ